MKKRYRCWWLVGLLVSGTILAFSLMACAKNAVAFTDAYLAQGNPGLSPKIFAPGTVSSDLTEHSAPIFSPDGQEVYWTSLFEDEGLLKIRFMRSLNGQWSTPQVAPFSGNDTDANPFFSGDGNKLYFKSYRPSGSGGQINALWVTTRTETGWSEPVPLGKPFLHPGLGWQASMADNGTIYFTLDGAGGQGSWDIFRSELVDGHYQEPDNLGAQVNSPYEDWAPFIAPDESYLIFGSYNRPDGYGGSDLYISYQESDGSWTQARNLGKPINSRQDENFAFVSNDGRHLFYVQSGTVYWVSASIVEKR